VPSFSGTSLIKQGRAEESRARGRGGDDESDGEDKWKAPGSDMLPANTVRTIPDDDSAEGLDSDDEEVVVSTRKRRRLMRGSRSIKKLKIETNSNKTVRLSIMSFPIPRSPSDALYPSRISRSNPTRNLTGRLSTPRSLVLSAPRLLAPCRFGDSPRGDV